jgi:hypothetical protein
MKTPKMNKKKPTIPCSDCHLIVFDKLNSTLFDIAKNIRYKVFVEEQGFDVMQNNMTHLGKSKDNMYLYAQKNAVNFYKTFGFVTVGSLFKDAGADHYKMIYRT